MLQPKSTATTLLLAALMAVGPLATDMYLPALPSIGRAFNADTGQVQLTLSVYMLGFALSQLICGPLADRFGRKPVILTGLVIFVIGTIGCALATNIETMIGLRLLQALGGCVGPVLGRATVRDIHGPREATHVLSYMAMVMALAPAIAPIIGGYLLVATGWPFLFTVLAIYAVVITVLVAVILPESLDAANAQSIRPGVILENYVLMLSSRTFVGYTLCCGFVFGGFFSFLSGSPFVLIEFLGVPKQRYGLYFLLVVGGFISGALIAGQLSGRWGTNRLMLYGSLLACVAGLSMAALSAANIYHIAAVIGPFFLFAMSMGIVIPQATGAALGPFPTMAGSASALLGFIQMALAAGAGALVGVLHDGTSHSMAFIIGAMGIGTLVSCLFVVRDSASVGLHAQIAVTTNAD